MANETTIYDLPRECIGTIFGKLSPKERASTIALVCKVWYEAEADNPFQPLILHLQPSAFTLSFLRWHLRDASRLQEVFTLTHKQHSPNGETVQILLERLSKGAPQLRMLRLVLTGLALDQELHRQDPAFQFMPLVGEMGGLRSLALLSWTCTAADLPFISHLSRLKRLEILELADFKFAKVLAGDSSNWDVQVFQAGLKLQSALLSICCLTQLQLRDVACPTLFPVENLGNLTSLRSLHISDELMIPFRIAGLTELTALTKLWFADEFGCAAYLRNLSSLKDLTYNVPQYEDVAIVISEEAVLTRLVMLGITDHDLGDLLPQQTLRSVRDLTLCSAINGDYLEGGEPGWPLHWHQHLPHLTRIACNFPGLRRPHHVLKYLRHGLQAECLVHVEWSTTMANFQGPALQILFCLWDSPRKWAVVQVHIYLKDVVRNRSSEIESLLCIGQSVCLCVPHLQFAIADDAKLPPGVEFPEPSPEKWISVRFTLPDGI